MISEILEPTTTEVTSAPEVSSTPISDEPSSPVSEPVSTPVTSEPPAEPTSLSLPPILPDPETSTTASESTTTASSSASPVTTVSTPITSEPTPITTDSTPVTEPTPITTDSTPITEPTPITTESTPVTEPTPITTDSTPVTEPTPITTDSTPITTVSTPTTTDTVVTPPVSETDLSTTVSTPTSDPISDPGSVTSPPTITSTPVPTPPTTTIITTPGPGDNNSTTVDPPTSEPPTSTTEPPALTTSSPVDPVTSIRPISTLTDPDAWLPTTIIGAPTTSLTFTAPTRVVTATTSQGFPSGLPVVIRPQDDTDETAPEGTVPIQIGFEYQLNYQFVAENPTAAAQIFQYLPWALADAAGIDRSRIPVIKLVPFDTVANLGYWTTLAKLHYPETLIDNLQMDLWTRNSPLYNNDLSIVRDLTAIINPRINLLGDDESGLGGAENNNGNGNENNGGGNNNNDAFDSGNRGEQSSSQQGTTAAIAVGAFGLSVMYGAAMFIVARRYKRKRQAHQRSSSVGTSEMSESQYGGNGSPALMGGALMSQEFSNYGGVAGGRESHGSGRSGMNNSVRTAGISAPVAASNTLGWN
ncbi:hypothetical protein B0I35DRAFT_348315 [Stachybotrys elegans]|uniref:Uncharacterized protein n=1 Tax=Stachybotrys elegans TaxID=80388 RepID=A0A8K0WUB6_9HYPO|nr:hypothetical protein B0I35DRAFT_348315 [Stachybotrys elegans]